MVWVMDCAPVSILRARGGSSAIQSLQQVIVMYSPRTRR